MLVRIFLQGYIVLRAIEYFVIPQREVNFWVEKSWCVYFFESY